MHVSHWVSDTQCSQKSIEVEHRLHSVLELVSVYPYLQREQVEPSDEHLRQWGTGVLQVKQVPSA